MVVQVQRVRDGRLRARFRSGEWQFSDRVSWHICDHGKRPDEPPRPAREKVPQTPNPPSLIPWTRQN